MRGPTPSGVSREAWWTDRLALGEGMDVLECLKLNLGQVGYTEIEPPFRRPESR